jgi:hypothetical protein
MRSNIFNTLLEIVIFFSFFSIQFHLQAQTVSFTAEANAEEVVIENSFVIAFRLENADIRNIDFPDFEKAGFKVLSGPSNATSYNNINGKTTTSESYVFELLPKKVGELTIGSAKVITSRGKTMKSKPVRINVVQANTNSFYDIQRSSLPPSLAGKVLFKVVTDKKSAIVGEDIVLDYKIYTQLDLMNIEFAEEPSFKGFSTRYRPVDSYDAQIEVVNGRQYAVKTIYRINLIPEKVGKLKIEPALVNVTVGNAYNISFSNPQFYSLYSNPLEIEVLSLSKTPKYFSGAIGIFSMSVETGKTQISSDNIFKIDITIHGEGDAAKINDLKILYPDSKIEPFEALPPKVKEFSAHQFDPYRSEAHSEKKKFEFKLNPLAIGEFMVKPTFIYYDTKRKEFVTLDTTIIVKVTQGNKKLSPLNPEKSDLENKKINYSFTTVQQKANWYPMSSPLFGSSLFWLISCLPLAVLGAGKLFAQYREKRLLLIAGKKQRQKAELDLEVNMSKVKESLESGNQQSFYQNLSETLKTYMSAKLNISSGDFNTKQLSESLIAKKADENILKRLLIVLNVCEQAVYAAQNNDAEMHRIFAETNDILNYYLSFFKNQ